MTSIRKRLIVVGDRILVKPAEGEERTEAGLYLPASAQRTQEVQGGRIINVGPGVPVPEPADYDEPWKKKPEEPRYVPLQAQVGDYALFLKKAAVEITFEQDKYLIVPNAAVLVLAREELNLGDALEGIEGFGDEDDRTAN